MTDNPNKPRVFTRENPCTKVELWNCFKSKGGFKIIPVVEAKTLIGENAPKYMLKKGYIREGQLAGMDVYRVSISGEQWLLAGIRRYLELHPERRAELVYKPTAAPAAPMARKAPKMARMARVRPQAGPAPAPAPARRLARQR